MRNEHSPFGPASQSEAAPPAQDGLTMMMTPPAPSLSIVISVYNEMLRLPETITKITQYLKSYAGPSEILIADDGSTDGSPAAIRKEFPHVRMLSTEHNTGKGGAVRRGMLAATGDLRLFSDADLSTPIGELDGMIEMLQRDGCEVVIASRGLPDSRLVVRQPWWREISGRTFNALVRPLSGLPFADTQCGFKLFTKRAAETIFPRQRCLTWAFDVELLMLARAHGLKVQECPVEWINNTASKVSLMRDAPRMFGDIVRFRVRRLKGEMTREP